MPPGEEGHPEHDEAESGQEELYVTLKGSGEIEIDGERHPIDSEWLARVGPGVSRKLRPGAEGIRVLIVGGVPGAAYEAPPMTKLGAPDPSVQTS